MQIDSKVGKEVLFVHFIKTKICPLTAHISRNNVL